MARLSARLGTDATVAILMENNGLGEIRIDPLPIVAKRKPIPAKSVVTDARGAVLEFLGEVNDSIGYDFMAFKHLRLAYASLTAEKGWPPLSDKSLSQTLQMCGCARRQLDDRKSGKGRPVAFRVPDQMGMAA